MMSIARGSAIWLAERTLLAFPVDARPEWVETLALSRLTNPGFIGLVVLAALTAILLRATRFGRRLYAVGSNEAAGRRLRRDPVEVVAYAMAGLLTGWAGVLLFAHGDSGNPARQGWNSRSLRR